MARLAKRWGCLENATTNMSTPIPTILDIQLHTAGLRQQAASQPWMRQGMVMVDALEYDELKARTERLEQLWEAAHGAPVAPEAIKSPEERAWDEVVAAVCRTWSCSPEVLTSKSREADLVRIRHTAIWLLNRVFSMPSRVIAKRMGMTTGMAACATARIDQRRGAPGEALFTVTLDALAAALRQRSNQVQP